MFARLRAGIYGAIRVCEDEGLMTKGGENELGVQLTNAIHRGLCLPK